MPSFQNLVDGTRHRLKAWLANNLPTLGVITGVGVTAWSIGATLGQLSLEAQVLGWGTAITTLSAELGKEFVVGLVERIRDQELGPDEIARIVQEELDKNSQLSDLPKLLDALHTLPITLQEILRLNDAQLLSSFQADMAAYPQLVSRQTAELVQKTLAPRIDALARDLVHLDTQNQYILNLLSSLASTATLSLTPNSEPPLVVFVSSLIGELSGERQALRQTITALGITKPWIFEHTPASAQPVEDAYLEKVRECDFFILLIDENVSPAVEREFDVAMQQKRPILAFLKKDKDDKDHYRTRAANALIKRIPTKWAAFSDPTDLALKARAAISDEAIRRVRSGLLSLPDAQIENLKQTEKILSKALLNLPPKRYSRLIGREEKLSTILQKLRTIEPVSSSVIAITGLGGIGKTALAYEIAERALLERLFDGLVWESAKPAEMEGGHIVLLSMHSALSFDSLISSIARQLGFENLQQLTPSELLSRIRSILQSGSYLIIVDNLDTVEAYEKLARELHGLLSPSISQRPSRVVLTSRERLIGIPFIDDNFIGGLEKAASMEFIRQEANNREATGILQAGQRLLDRIFKVTSGMPLAMKLIVSQFISGIPLDTELNRLEGAKEEELYRFIYMDLWFKLSIPAQKVLIAAAAFASSVARFMLQPVSKTADDEFEAAIPELVRMSLLESSDHPTAAQRRYSIHPITRWFINAPLKELWEQQKANSHTT